MIHPNRIVASDEDAVPDRLWLKLAGLFVLSFLGFAIVFFAYEIFIAFGQDKAAGLPADTKAASIVIDPKIETELAKVLDTNTAANMADIKDPFSDRAGLSGVAAARAKQTTQAVSAAGTTASGSNASATTAVSGNAGAGAANPPPISPIEATKQRYAKWLERLEINGDEPLDPRIFAVEDLLPVGIVDGGSGQQEVMFYSEAAGKTLSFPIGTLFSNGWLSELRPEGVVFTSNDDRRTVRMRSWARSFKSAG